MHLPLFQSKAVIKPLFELCGDGDDIKSQYYLFGKQFEYWFYTAWCANQVRFMFIRKAYLALALSNTNLSSSKNTLSFLSCLGYNCVH